MGEAFAEIAWKKKNEPPKEEAGCEDFFIVIHPRFLRRVFLV